MPRKIDQPALSAAIKKFNSGACTNPKCKKGKVGLRKCSDCRGTGKRQQ